MKFRRILASGLLLGTSAFPLLAIAAIVIRGEGELRATSAASRPALSSPTPRTVTDQRQLRITVVAVPGPEVAAGAARGTVTSVTAKAGEALADGAVVFQVDGIDRVGFASSIPFYRPIAPNTEGAVKTSASSTGLIDFPPPSSMMTARPMTEEVPGVAFQGHNPPPPWWLELADIHLKGMRPELKRTLIRLFRGMAREAIGKAEGVEESTIKVWIATATSEIASRLTKPHPDAGELRGGWVVVHIECCLKEELRQCA